MEGWTTIFLGELCGIEIGGTPARKNPKLWDPAKNSDNVWLSIADLPQTLKARVSDSKEYISDEASKKAKLVHEGTLLVSFKLTLGRLAFAGRDLYTNEAIAALTILDDRLISNSYLYWYLTFFDWQKAAECDHKIKGKTLNKAKLQMLPVLVPSLAEQERIVAFLDEAFAAIATATANAEKNLINARELFENELNRVFSHKSDGWEEREFGDTELIEIIDGDRGVNYPKKSDFYSDGYCLFLNTKNVRPDGFNFETTQFITKEKDSALRKGKIKRRDVVLTTRGTVGNTAIYDNDVEFDHIRINSGMLILRPNESIILAEFLFWVLQSGLIKRQIAKLTSGAAQPQLPIRTLVRFVLLVPKNLEEQRQLVLTVKELSHRSKLFEYVYQQKLALLTALKNSLLHKAFTGGLTAGTKASERTLSEAGL